MENVSGQPKWKLVAEDKEIDLGYWPGSIFNRLSDRAEGITWGWEIVNYRLLGPHTSTQMGAAIFLMKALRKQVFSE